MMNHKFHDIAMGMQVPRRTGKTEHMLRYATMGALVLCVDHAHMHELQSRARCMGRSDLRFYVPLTGIHGMQGPFEFDHYTIEKLLFEADAELARTHEDNQHKAAVIETNVREMAKLRAEVERLTAKVSHLQQPLTISAVFIPGKDASVVVSQLVR